MSDPSTEAALEAALQPTATLPMLEALALSRHPSLVAGAHRVRAMVERARADGKLPAPEFMAEIWQVPFARPYALDQAGMATLGVRQKFPAPGSLDRMAEASAWEAQAEAAKVASEARALVRDMDRAFADYLEATERSAAHRAHQAVVEQMKAVAQTRFTTGAGLALVARIDLEQARTESDLAREHGMADQARARINGLLSRPLTAPLGPPDAGEAKAVALSLVALVERAQEWSPEVEAATRMHKAAAATMGAAEREAQIPEFMVGVQAFMPVSGTPAGYGATFGMTLPWLWGAGTSRVRSAEEKMRAEQASVASTRLRVGSEAAAALASTHGAVRRYVALRDLARPAAQRAVEAARAGYATGSTELSMWLEAAQALLEVDMEVASARADLERSLADLDFAVGDHVPRAPLPTSTEGAHRP